MPLTHAFINCIQICKQNQKEDLNFLFTCFQVGGQKKVHVVTRLYNLSLSQQCVDKFFGFIQREGSFGTEAIYCASQKRKEM